MPPSQVISIAQGPEQFGSRYRNPKRSLRTVIGRPFAVARHPGHQVIWKLTIWLGVRTASMRAVWWLGQRSSIRG